MGDLVLGKLRCVVFDLDDTLFDKSTWLIPAVEFAAGQMGLDAQAAWLIASRYIEERGFADASLFNAVLTGLGQSDNALNIRAFYAWTNQYIPPAGSLELYPGAREVLLELSGRFKLGLIADGAVATQQAKVNALKLGPLMHAVIYSDAIEGVRSRRPDPRPYREVLMQLGSNSAVALFVGDNPMKDFIRAKVLGWATARVLTGEYANVCYPSPEHAAGYELSSVARLPALINGEARSYEINIPSNDPSMGEVSSTQH